MGNEYKLTEDVSLIENSCRFQYLIGYSGAFADSKEITARQLRLSIIRQIQALSYFVKDPDEVLKRFNVDYGDTY